MSKKRQSNKVKNSIAEKQNIKSGGFDDSFKNENIIMDFSFKGLFLSNSENNKFNNFLKDEKDFTKQFKLLHKNVILLSQHTMNELLQGHRHCHKILGEAEEKLKFILRKYFDLLKISEEQYLQEIEDEELFQLGEQDEIRFFGSVNNNIFKVYLIDYFHTLYNDEKYNLRKERNYKYTVMTTYDLENLQ